MDNPLKEPLVTEKANLENSPNEVCGSEIIVDQSWKYTHAQMKARDLGKESSLEGVAEEVKREKTGEIARFKIIRNLRPSETSISTRLFDSSDWDTSIHNLRVGESIPFSADDAVKQGILVVQKQLDLLLVNFHGEMHNYSLSFDEEAKKIEVYGEPMLKAYLEAKINDAYLKQLNMSLVACVEHLYLLSRISYLGHFYGDQDIVAGECELPEFGYEVILGYGFVKLWTLS